MSRGVYIHIPFCKNICTYCDFCKMYYQPKWASDYLEQLKNEILDVYLEDEIKTIYIGGGTPSSLSKKELEKLFSLLDYFQKEKDIEITFECNLNDISVDLVKILKENKVNRISIGIQSFQPHILKMLGRKHTFADAEEKIKLLRKYGFSNINLDLIYAVPHQTLRDLKKDLKLFLKLNPDHISTYSLMIEPNTYLSYKRIEPISEDLDSKMYYYIIKYLQKYHFNHYEISNFAKSGKESRHNLIYWNNEEYYGFGLSASGYLESTRYTNTKNLSKYLRGFYDGERELLTKKDIMDNELMLGFRKMEGINIQEFEQKYQVKMEDAYPINILLKNKDLTKNKEYIFISRNKLYIMNEILLKMI